MIADFLEFYKARSTRGQRFAQLLTDADIDASFSSMLCRCGTYANVLQAVTALVKGNQNG